MTDGMGKVCPQIFRGTGRSEAVCHTSRQSPQKRSFRVADPPETHQGCPGSCTSVSDFKERTSCPIGFGLLYLKTMSERWCCAIGVGLLCLLIQDRKFDLVDK